MFSDKIGGGREEREIEEEEEEEEAVGEQEKRKTTLSLFLSLFLTSLPEDEVVGSEDGAKGARADRVHGARLCCCCRCCRCCRRRFSLVREGERKKEKNKERKRSRMNRPTSSSARSPPPQFFPTDAVTSSARSFASFCTLSSLIERGKQRACHRERPGVESKPFRKREGE